MTSALRERQQQIGPVPLQVGMSRAEIYAAYELTCPPRVGTLRNPARKTYGVAVARIAAQLGQPLMPWQRYTVDTALEVDPESGYLAYRDVTAVVPRQSGKALDVDTPLLTAAGWSTMGTVRIGDQVYAPNGRLTTVTAVSPVMREHDCYRVTTTDGRSLVADADHLWTVQDRLRERSAGPRGARSRTYEWRVMTTRQILVEGLMRQQDRTVRTGGTEYTSREFRFRLPRQRCLQSTNTTLPIEPYLFGVWLGDGAAAAGQISIGFDDFDATMHLLRAAGHEIVSSRRDRTCWTVRVRGLQASLRALGVLGAKRVPDVYLTAGTGQRLALLQGLLDTDGSISTGNSGTPRVEFCSMNHDLATAVLYLARSLGWRATIRTGAAQLDGRVIGTKWRVCFTPSTEDPQPFRMPRKAGRVATPRSRGGELHAVSIVAVDPVESRPVRCIKVDSEDELYLAGHDLIATHNTTLILSVKTHRALKMGSEAVRFRPTQGNRQFILYAAQKLLAARRKFVEEHLPVLEKSPYAARFKKRLANGSESILWDTGALDGITANTETSGHGPTLDLAVEDEFWAAEDARLEQAFSPAMVTRWSPQHWRVSTEGTERSTYMATKVDLGRAVVESGEDTQICYLEWSDHDGDREDPRTWLNCMPALCPTPGDCACSPNWRHTVTLETIAGELEKFRTATDEFDRAYLNRRKGSVLPPDENLPSPAKFALQVNERATPGSVVAFGMEITRGRDAGAIVAAWPGEDTTRHLKVIEYRPGIDWMVGRARELDERWHPVAWGLDVVGPVRALLTALTDKVADGGGGFTLPEGEPKHGQLACPSVRDVAAASGMVATGIRDGWLWHEDQKALNDAYKIARTRPLGDSWAFDRKVGDCSTVIAGSVGLWSLETRKHLLPEAAVPNIW